MPGFLRNIANNVVSTVTNTVNSVSNVVPQLSNIIGGVGGSAAAVVNSLTPAVSTVLNSSAMTALGAGVNAAAVQQGALGSYTPPAMNQRGSGSAGTESGFMDKIKRFFCYYKMDENGNVIVDVNGKKSLNWFKIGAHAAVAFGGFFLLDKKFRWVRKWA